MKNTNKKMTDARVKELIARQKFLMNYKSVSYQPLKELACNQKHILIGWHIDNALTSSNDKSLFDLLFIYYI